MAQEIPRQSEIEERWRSLNPIFIMGRQRTGTSIMWRSLRAADFRGFPEGHLWFDIVEAFARLRDPTYQENIRQDIFTLGSERNYVLEKRFAVMMDQFHRDLLGSDLGRWVDKSPGIHAVQAAPMLAELFPRAQFIFMLRNPITTVHSTIHYVPKNRDRAAAVEQDDEETLYRIRVTCRHWVRVMESWRQVRPLLAGRYIEVPQEHLVETPVGIAERLAEFLGIPGYAEAIAEVFQSRRENTAFPEKEVKEFFYPVNWTDEQEAVLTDICQDEMEVWGYPLDFQRPSGPDLPPVADDDVGLVDMLSYCRWLEIQGQNQKYIELAAYREALARINQGRLMRVLNGLDRFLRRVGLR